MNSTLTYTNPAFSILNLQLFSSSSWVTLSPAMQSNLNIPKWVLNIYNATSKSPHPPAKSCLPPTLCTTLPLSLSLLFLLHKPHTNCCYIAKGLANIFICSLCSGHTTNTRHTHRHTPKVRNPLRRTRHTPKKKEEKQKRKRKRRNKNVWNYFIASVCDMWKYYELVGNWEFGEYPSPLTWCASARERRAYFLLELNEFKWFAFGQSFLELWNCA